MDFSNNPDVVDRPSNDVVSLNNTDVVPSINPDVGDKSKDDVVCSICVDVDATLNWFDVVSANIFVVVISLVDDGTPSNVVV